MNMSILNDMIAEDIRKMSYNELIGLTRETNRTPGGLETIKKVAQTLLLNKDTRLLDIGTSTGHTALEFSRLVGSHITGIDINEMSLQTSRERAKRLGLKNVDFVCADATSLPFNDNSFDVVFCGNVTSLVNDPKKALSEYWRVLIDQGFLVAVPMYYIKTPMEALVQDVRDAIQVNIQVQTKKDWIDFYLNDDVEIYDCADFAFNKMDDHVIRDFCVQILERKHLASLSSSAKVALKECYEKYMFLFNENLSHMGYSVLTLRKKEEVEFNDPELYTSRAL